MRFARDKPAPKFKLDDLGPFEPFSWAWELHQDSTHLHHSFSTLQLAALRLLAFNTILNTSLPVLVSQFVLPNLSTPVAC